MSKEKRDVLCKTPKNVWFFSLDKSQKVIADHELDLAANNHEELVCRLRKAADYIERHKKHTIEINSSN